MSVMYIRNEQTGEFEPVPSLVGPQGPPGSNGDGAGTVTAVNNVAPDATGNVTLTAADVGARPDNWMPTAADVGALPSDGTAVNANALNGKSAEYYTNPRNLLDNSDFTNPVNQRGETSYSGKGYTIDRWLCDTDVSQVTVNDGYITVVGGSRFLQIPALDITGKTVTLAVEMLDGAVYCNSAKIPSAGSSIQYAAATAIDDIRIRIIVQENYVPRIQITSSTTDISIKWIALYEGSYTADNLPPYAPKGYSAELAECQRYAYPLPKYGGVSGYITSEGKQFIFPVACPPMRDAGDTKPTVSEPIPQMTIRTVSGYSSIATQEAPGTPKSLAVQDYSPDSHQMTLCATFESVIGDNNTPAYGQIRYGVRPLISLDL